MHRIIFLVQFLNFCATVVREVSFIQNTSEARTQWCWTGAAVFSVKLADDKRKLSCTRYINKKNIVTCCYKELNRTTHHKLHKATHVNVQEAISALLFQHIWSRTVSAFCFNHEHGASIKLFCDIGAVIPIICFLAWGRPDIFGHAQSCQAKHMQTD